MAGLLPLGWFKNREKKRKGGRERKRERERERKREREREVKQVV